MQALEPPHNKLLAPVREGPRVDPEIFVLSRDLATVLSAPEFLGRLEMRDSLRDTLNRLVGTLTLSVHVLPARLNQEEFECVPGVAALHPVPPHLRDLC